MTKKIENYEKLLRDYLKEYIITGDSMKLTLTGEAIVDKELLKNTRKAEYVYKVFPLWNGGYNEEGKRGNLHVLMPKTDFYGIDISQLTFEIKGEIVSIPSEVDKKMCFSVKEVID